MIEELIKLDNDYGLDKLCQAKIITPLLIKSMNIYLKYDCLVKQGMDKKVAIAETAQAFNVCSSWVYKSIAKMKSK
jgi:hypothetical protein